MIVGDREIPELMLQDDGDVLRMLRAQAVRHLHAVGLGIERDVEMMLAGQAVFRGVSQDVAHHAAQGLLGENIVADMVRGHPGNLPHRTGDSETSRC